MAPGIERESVLCSECGYESGVSIKTGRQPDRVTDIPSVLQPPDGIEERNKPDWIQRTTSPESIETDAQVTQGRQLHSNAVLAANMTKDVQNCSRQAWKSPTQVYCIFRSKFMRVIGRNCNKQGELLTGRTEDVKLRIK